jgi:hypothetical protein
MESNSKGINQENFNEWLSSLGFIFPKSLKENARFDKLYSDHTFKLDENTVDPSRIINGEIRFEDFVKTADNFNMEINNEIRLAARGFKELPEHILKKIKKNQDGQGDGKVGIPENED